MVSEPATELWASKDAAPKGVDFEISFVGGGKRSIPYKGVETSP